MPGHLLETCFAGALATVSSWPPRAAPVRSRRFPDIGAAVLTGLLTDVDTLNQPVEQASNPQPTRDDEAIGGGVFLPQAAVVEVPLEEGLPWSPGGGWGAGQRAP